MTPLPPPLRSYPDAIRQDLVDDLHGVPVPDPYRWLEDAGDPRTLLWMTEQQGLYEAERSAWPGLAGWQAEAAALNARDQVMPPKARADVVFFRRQRAGQDHPELFVLTNGAERSLLDMMELDPTGRTMLDAWAPSTEGRLLAYQVSRDGTEDSRLLVLDVDTGSVVDGPIDRVRRTSIGWLPGGELFYYVRRLAPELHPGEERYHRRVWLHRVGTDPAEDVMVFGEGRDMTQFYGVSVTPDGRWLTITATTGADPCADLYLADLSASCVGRPRLRAVREGARVRTELHIAPGTGPADPVWLRTSDHAPRGRVVACTPARHDAASWREIIAERGDSVLEELAIVSGAKADPPIGLVRWTRHAVSEITVHDLSDGRELGRVQLPGIGSTGGFVVEPSGSLQTWFPYTDYTTPPRVLRHDARDGQVRSWPQEGAGSDFCGMSTSQVAFTSGDGTMVRMFVVSPQGRPDRPRPAILTGYGGFGASMSPVFSPYALAWVKAGGIFATACLRGGGEEGEEWHLSGRGERKQNVFDDFFAATDYLVEAGWAGEAQIAIMGSSNGGLLVGAAITQHPEKYAAAVCLAPLLDMIRYELSGLGPSWAPEYGTAKDPEQLRTLLSYSPYHRVTRGTAYPPVLFAVSDGDTRVDPLHARKMCAALQHASAGPGPVLMRLERGAGHGVWATSREAALQADCLAFLACHLELAPPGGEV